MKIKKIIPILICLMIIFNLIIPTVVLAKNEITDKTTNATDANTTNETKNENNSNTETNNNINNNTTNTSKNENAIEKNEISDNTTKNETEENKVNNNTSNNTINQDEIDNKVESNIENKTEENKAIINKDGELHVQYRTHVQEEGWQGYVQDGETSGTSGKAYRLEAININLLNNADKNIGIKYQVHVQEEGWQDWKRNGEMAGTSGKAYRLEAIKIELENTEEYSVMYRVHVQEEGWQGWRTDGEMAGTSGKAYRLEAIEIKIVKKQKKGMLNIESPTNGKTYYNLETPSINVVGWKMANVSNTTIKAYIDNTEIEQGKISYSGRADVVQAITGYGTAEQNPTPGYSFNVDTTNLSGGNHTIKIELCYKDEIISSSSSTFYLDTTPHVRYSAHVQDIGWQGYVQDGATIGTTKKAKRVKRIGRAQQHH